MGPILPALAQALQVYSTSTAEIPDLLRRLVAVNPLAAASLAGRAFAPLRLMDARRIEEEPDSVLAELRLAQAEVDKLLGDILDRIMEVA